MLALGQWKARDYRAAELHLFVVVIAAVVITINAITQ